MEQKNHLMLYRKYRPNIFDQIIGQDYIIKILKNQIISNNISHAYLFTGTRGVGKTSIARIFAKAINCTNTNNGNPCNNCTSCKNILYNNVTDIIEIDAASNNGVNEIKELCNNTQYMPFFSKYKIYIIDEVHMLSISAFNALLKTLEEPPKHIVFVLVTTDPYKIPHTILSRCMRFDLVPINSNKILNYLKKIFDENNKKYEEEALIEIVEEANGSMRDALSTTEIFINDNYDILNYEHVCELTGSVNENYIFDIIVSILNKNIKQATKNIEYVQNHCINIDAVFSKLINILKNLIIVKNSQTKNDNLLMSDAKYKKYKYCVQNIDNKKLIYILEMFVEYEYKIKYSMNKETLFSFIIFKALNSDESIYNNNIQTKIENIEKKLFVLIDKYKSNNNIK